ncbi:hypothetical protein D3C75_1015140 [compost metagenome]
MIFEDAVHGADVVGDGGRVGFGGFGQHVGRIGKGGQLGAGKPGDGALNVVGRADKGLGVFAVIDGELQGLLVEQVQALGGNAE